MYTYHKTHYWSQEPSFLKLEPCLVVDAVIPAAYLSVDLESVQFPLVYRPADPSLYFQPFGMEGKSKSVYKVLKEKGIESVERGLFYVLVDQGGQIIIPGIGIDERLRLSPDTKTVLKVHLEDKSVWK